MTNFMVSPTILEDLEDDALFQEHYWVLHKGDSIYFFDDLVVCFKEAEDYFCLLDALVVDSCPYSKRMLSEFRLCDLRLVEKSALVSGLEGFDERDVKADLALY